MEGEGKSAVYEERDHRRPWGNVTTNTHRDKVGGVRGKVLEGCFHKCWEKVNSGSVCHVPSYAPGSGLMSCSQEREGGGLQLGAAECTLDTAQTPALREAWPRGPDPGQTRGKNKTRHHFLDTLSFLWLQEVRGYCWPLSEYYILRQSGQYTYFSIFIQTLRDSFNILIKQKKTVLCTTCHTLISKSSFSLDETKAYFVFGWIRRESTWILHETKHFRGLFCKKAR